MMLRTISELFRGKPKSIVPGANVKLPMIHVHTFRDGTRLYTYKPEHYTEICYRHYEQLSELQRYIQTFAVTKEEWKKGISDLRATAKAALDGKDRAEALIQCIKIADHFEARMENLKTPFEALSEFTFCMFFTIDGEPPATWSPTHNERKLELLKAEPEVRAFFFSSLANFTENFVPISAKDTAGLLIALEDLKAASEVNMT